MKLLIVIPFLILFNTCDNPIKNNQDIDCTIDLGGFYDDCGICSGGISEHEPNSDLECEYNCTNGVKDDCGECNMNNASMDLCNICFGQNITCNRGLLSKSNWNFKGIKLWDNIDCEGIPYYTINNELCILDNNESIKCFAYNFNFTDEIYIINNIEYFIFKQEVFYSDGADNFQGLWRINNTGLCLIYEDSNQPNPGEECMSGTIEDCDGLGECWPESWIDDGYPDCEDQQYGADLTCYDNDGGDCGGLQMNPSTSKEFISLNSTEHCYSLIDFKNNYYDCKGDDIYLCEDNEVSLLSKNSDSQTCSKEILHSDDLNATRKTIILDEDIQLFPASIRDILLHQKNIYE